MFASQVLKGTPTANLVGITLIKESMNYKNFIFYTLQSWCVFFLDFSHKSSQEQHLLERTAFVFVLL